MVNKHKFYGRDMSGILFFMFASCHPLICDILIQTPFQSDIWFWGYEQLYEVQKQCKTYELVTSLSPYLEITISDI